MEKKVNVIPQWELGKHRIVLIDEYSSECECDREHLR